jgi:hypothetical protein
MNLKKHTLTGLFASAVSASQTSVGLSLGQDQGPPTRFECKEVVQDFVLLDSLLFECQNKPAPTPAEILQCQQLVACLIEEGFVVDQNTITEADITPGASTGSSSCVMVPTKCTED